MRKALWAFLAVAFIAVDTLANPHMEFDYVYLKASPPEIALTFNLEIDLSLDTIFTSSGFAIIDSGIIGQWDLVLDSSNTTGFTLNLEGDSIAFSDYNMEWYHAYYGNLGQAPTLINGHTIDCREYGYWSFDFSFVYPGGTNVVINEINSHGSWSENSNFIELYNLSDSVISLNNWIVVGDTIYDLPSDAVILPHGYYVIDVEDFPDNFDMDFATDNVYLVNFHWGYNCNYLVDQVGWSSDHGENVSFMRHPDGDTHNNHWLAFLGFNDSSSFTFENGFPSRGAPNRHESPGFVVIGTRAHVSDDIIYLDWTNPIWDAGFEGTMVVKNEDHFPGSPIDGSIIYSGDGQAWADEEILPEQWYYYTVFAVNHDGGYSTPTDESRVSVYSGGSVGIDELGPPDRISFLSAHPNPFNPTTTIEYGLLESGVIRLTIHNLLGQRVVTVFEGMQEAGDHSVTWDASAFPSGVYFARLEAGGHVENVKMALVK